MHAAACCTASAPLDRMRARTILLSLLAALALNIAVAWGFAIALDVGLIELKPGRTDVPVDVWPGAIPVSWDSRPATANEYGGLGLTAVEVLGMTKRDREREARFEFGSLFIAYVSMTHLSTGFPLRALARDEFSDALDIQSGKVVPSVPWSWRQGLALQRRDMLTGARGISLPLVVKWPALLINWAVYTLCLIAWPAWRTIRRRSLGQCVACGYPLSRATGARCAECGKASA